VKVVEMDYLNWERLESLDENAFLATKPYPWVNPAGCLTEEGFRKLRETLPPVDKFQRIFGKKRSFGQQSHDRFALEYDESVELSAPWREFIAELESPRYRRFLRRMFGRGGLSIAFHWHYTPNGCSVSPHCDAVQKLGSHIFYLNTTEDWDPTWGGETVVLDDHGRFGPKSAPAWEDFDTAAESNALGNYSLIFARGESSWHGVREIHCPPDRLRKVFIVVVNDRLRAAAKELWARVRGKKAAGY
jgi:2OG-Fe(II) oxygenase superfamily